MLQVRVEVYLRVICGPRNRLEGSALKELCKARGLEYHEVLQVMSEVHYLAA